MNIPGISLSDSLANVATGMKSDSVSMQIAVAVMKQAQRQQQIQAEGLLKMIQNTPTLDGTGNIVNIGA